ncbi:hypothetical protein NC652_012786 [Populus alba x Populus x berolinensis]|uniref:Uncharacterized protein n=1 Tax=Populus alba x Populus x berolinensis TaxID=444605 RepID=A0AAD6QTR1_9ROSI|nr:hypothetical protein NC652_012786 [Populus alba x Populus x berolinensis]KAJ6995990.1 hypothetical protein NC653_012770 [Populus alba x Populus x berolinensis]
MITQLIYVPTPICNEIVTRENIANQDASTKSKIGDHLP